jgi:carboxymethylenebutenolidase
MSRFSVTVEARAGRCPASLLTPTWQARPWPAVIFFMNGFGIRPAMWETGQRLADGDYVVLQPDLYYRGALSTDEPSGGAGRS